MNKTVHRTHMLTEFNGRMLFVKRTYDVCDVTVYSQMDEASLVGLLSGNWTLDTIYTNEALKSLPSEPGIRALYKKEKVKK